MEEKLLFKTDFLFPLFLFAHNKKFFAGVTALPSFCPIFCWNFIGEDILLKLYWWIYFVETLLVKIFCWNFIGEDILTKLHRPTCATHFTSPGHRLGSLKIIVNPNLGYLQNTIWILVESWMLILLLWHSSSFSTSILFLLNVFGFALYS